MGRYLGFRWATFGPLKPNRKEESLIDIPIEIISLLLDGIIKLVIELLTKGMKSLWDYFSNTIQPKKMKITMKHICNKKKATDHFDLGYCTNYKRPFRLNELDMRRHTFMVGASGLGKTNFLNILMEYNLQNNIPLLYFDPKGSQENIQSFKNLCKYYKKKAYIFSPTSPSNIHFNPLRDMEIAVVAETLMRAWEWSNEYYEAKCKEGIILAALQIKKKGRIVSIHSILEELKAFSKNEKEAVQGLISKLQIIAISKFGDLLRDEGEALTISDIRNENANLYIAMPTQGYNEIAKTIGKLFFNELMYHSFRIADRIDCASYAKEHPLSVYIDEAGSILYQGFIDLLNKCRESGIQITAVTQSYADIDVISQFLREQCIENSSNLIIQKQSSPKYVEEICKNIGTYESEKKTKVIDDGNETGMMSLRNVQEYIVHPNLLPHIRIGQCILVTHSPKNVFAINIRDCKTSKAFCHKIPIRKADMEKKKEFGSNNVSFRQARLT